MSSSLPRNAGFTLIEVMIVVVIIGVLMLVALPAYEGQQTRAKRTIAQVELLKIVARQEQFFVNNRAYSTTLAPLGFADPWVIDADGREVDDAAAGGVYSISLVEPTTMAFELHAVPLGQQARDTTCGTLVISSVGSKSVTGTGSSADCW